MSIASVDTFPVNTNSPILLHRQGVSKATSQSNFNCTKFQWCSMSLGDTKICSCLEHYMAITSTVLELHELSIPVHNKFRREAAKTIKATLFVNSRFLVVSGWPPPAMTSKYPFALPL